MTKLESVGVWSFRIACVFLIVAIAVEGYRGRSLISLLPPPPAA